jgi:hypothetical protein
MLRLEVRPELALELLEGRTHHVRAALEDAADGIVDFLFDAVVLALMAVKGSLDLGHIQKPLCGAVPPREAGIPGF